MERRKKGDKQEMQKKKKIDRPTDTRVVQFKMSPLP